eukprot:3689926-Alexandrium_andersonii.AAC.1
MLRPAIGFPTLTTSTASGRIRIPRAGFRPRTGPARGRLARICGGSPGPLTGRGTSLHVMPGMIGARST